ncbi:hypothetical protein LCGC14_2381480 [marine sediment metagenome]|uniref:Uncharacterized protein n=1 Tax=marine sediment metagenome TaxID=412755 RepID=A0A0F9C0Y0_9ZZZZ
MRKLTNVTYTNARTMSQEQKDNLLIPEEYYGSVAIESWNVNGKLVRKGVCVAGGITNYILGLGEFKDESSFAQVSNGEVNNGE